MSTEERHENDRLAAYADDRLEPAAREAVRRHLDGCTACAHELEALRAVERVLDADPAPAPLRPMWPAIAHRRDPVRRRALDLGFGFAAAVALAGGFMLGVVTFDRAAPADTQGARAAATAPDDWATAAEPSLSDVYFFENGSATQ